MKKQNGIFDLRVFLAVLVGCLIFSNAYAGTNAETSALVAKNLSKKLQIDLADKNVAVKIKDAAEYKISNGKVGFKGQAVCVFTDQSKQQMPIRFDAKINVAAKTVSDVEYDFIAAEYEAAPTSSEEVLMKEIMKQISRDYKTDNIVIALDNFENAPNSKNRFQGVGEVRIGDFVWKKMSFDVALDTDLQTAKKVVYNLEK